MDLGKTVNDLLNNSPQGSRIKEKKPELEKIVTSSDGEKVKRMLERRGGLQDAIESGDTETLTKTVQDILKTEEGARLAKQLENLFK